MMNISIKTLASALLDVIFPRTCSVCGMVLASHEKHICTKCSISIPRTLFHLHKFNPMEQLFAGKIAFERATGFFFYDKETPYSNILHDLKYRNLPQLGSYFASLFAKELAPYNYFSDIDYIIPVPLHKSKLIKRGYNQSEMIANGLAEVLNLPVLTNVIVATRPHETQTHKGIYERWQNTQDVFDAQHTHIIEGKHILIVDDVVTTGATLLNAALTIADVPNVKISFATLGVARLS